MLAATGAAATPLLQVPGQLTALIGAADTAVLLSGADGQGSAGGAAQTARAARAARVRRGPAGQPDSRDRAGPAGPRRDRPHGVHAAVRAPRAARGRGVGAAARRGRPPGSTGSSSVSPIRLATPGTCWPGRPPPARRSGTGSAPGCRRGRPPRYAAGSAAGPGPPARAGGGPVRAGPVVLGAARVGAPRRRATGHGDDLFFLSFREVLCVLRGESSPLAAVPGRRADLRAVPRAAGLPHADPRPVRPRPLGRRPRPAHRRLRRARRERAAGRGHHRVRRGARRRRGHGPGASARSRTPAELRDGEILVTTVTNIGWTPVFPRAAAVVTDVGAPLSHAAIVARELGVPAVVGCGNATMRIRTGDRIRVDGDGRRLRVTYASRRGRPGREPQPRGIRPPGRRRCPGQHGRDRGADGLDRGLAGPGVVDRLEAVVGAGDVDHLDGRSARRGRGQELVHRRGDRRALQLRPGHHDRQPASRRPPR